MNDSQQYYVLGPGYDFLAYDFCRVALYIASKNFMNLWSAS
jgi:hypothetical protein